MKLLGVMRNMLWNANDTDIFKKEKTYIDTVVVPLLPVSLGERMKLAASQGEFIQLLTDLLEKQFRGRLLLLPPCTYLETMEEERKQQLLSEWEDEITSHGTKYCVFITSDPFWRSLGTAVTSSLFWLPYIPLEHMDEEYKYSIIEDQVKQLIHVIAQKWQTVE